MRLRIWTAMSYIDIETKDNICKEEIERQLDAGNIVGIETKDNTMFYLNNINVVAIEVENNNTPPIKS